MARPRTPISSHGAISLAEVAPGKWRARSRYRFDNGTLRQVERFAPTKAKAKHALQSALTQMIASTGVDVKRETTLADLADRFLQSKSERAPRTVETYEQTIRHLIKPNIGMLSVSEATTDRMQRFIEKVSSENGAGAAKISRTVLSGMMGLAARSNAIRSNPIRELSPISRPGHGATAITLEELPKLLAAVRADDRLREVDAVELIEFLAATGCRIGEACALAWSDVDLEAGTMTVRANVVRATGRGLIRQDHTKTKAGLRTVKLPRTTIGMLGDRRIQTRPNPLGLVFPTVLGNLRDPRGTSRDWAEARVRLGYPDVSTHSFRKTVATALDQAGLSARDIAEYLGHANPSITQDVYMAKNTGGKRAAEALEGIVTA